MIDHDMPRIVNIRSLIPDNVEFKEFQVFVNTIFHPTQ